MKIASRNINWIRAIIQKWFFERIHNNNFDIICLQEVKAFENQIPQEVRYHLSDYNIVWHIWDRPWYAGTAIFMKKNISLIEKKSEFSFPEFSKEWRVTEISFKHNNNTINLINVYFPNGWTRADWTEMLSYKLNFYEDIRKYIQELRNHWNQVICCWDFNICHTEIDIARPKENENSIWFLPIERKEMDKLCEDWLIDCFRSFNPWMIDQYTRRSYRWRARDNNIWRRLDYFWVSPELLNNISHIVHQTNITWSDHCPIFIELQ